MKWDTIDERIRLLEAQAPFKQFPLPVCAIFLDVAEQSHSLLVSLIAVCELKRLSSSPEKHLSYYNVPHPENGLMCSHFTLATFLMAAFVSDSVGATD